MYGDFSVSHSAASNFEPLDLLSLSLSEYADSPCTVIDEPLIGKNFPLKDKTFSVVGLFATIGASEGFPVPRFNDAKLTRAPVISISSPLSSKNLAVILMLAFL